jgi:hypothetical protein
MHHAGDEMLARGEIWGYLPPRTRWAGGESLQCSLPPLRPTFKRQKKFQQQLFNDTAKISVRKLSQCQPRRQQQRTFLHPHSLRMAPHASSDGPLVKRQKTSTLAKRPKATDNASRIFAPFRVWANIETLSLGLLS